ncbi:MAG: hypothetical protein JSU01_17025 [Bacteroidetes bacterium]|nr:hypothetical protein [Bacteroidota bacterium]
MKPYFKPLTVKAVFALILIIVAIVIHSCHKDTRSSINPSNALKSDINVDIAQLQKIYSSAIQGTSLKINSGNSGVNLIRTLSVNWNTYTLQKRKDSSIIAEFDMNNDKGVVALRQYKLGDTIRYVNKTTAVFIQFKNGSRLNFFTKIIEDLASAGSKSVLDKMHYGEVPLGFSGLILYYTFGLTFINGYHFTNGIVDKTVTLSSTDPNSTKTTNSLQVDQTTCMVYPLFETDCTTGTAPDGTVYDQGCTT